jgi:general L-amino acid transport system substrate-binding protein
MRGRKRQVRQLTAALALVLIMLLGAACAAMAEPAVEDASTETESETAAPPAAGSRLESVRARGRLICASLDDTPGFGYVDESGNNAGFDIDLCRAVAAAVLGDPDAVEIRVVTAAERGPVMQSGEVDLLVYVTTWTTSRDASWGNFVQTMFYDGQGFMAPKSLGVTSAYELGGAAICVTTGTTSELNMADFFRQNQLEYSPKTFEEGQVAFEAYKSGSCEVVTTDRSALTALRSSLDNPDDHIILPETISEEPLGPMVPHGEEQWFDIVKIVMGILIYAEAYGINSGNVDEMAAGDNVKARRLLGTEGSFGQEELGLDQSVGQTVIKELGNYGEIYARNLGPETDIDLPREGSRNALWSDAPCSECPKGGQIYSQPLR